MRPQTVLVWFLVSLAVAVVALPVRSEYLSHQEAVRMAAVDRAQRAETAAVAREEAAALTATIAQRDQAQARAGELQAALAAANADKDKLKQENDQLKAQTAYQPVAYTTGYGGGGSPKSVAAAGNHFPWGFCTWYVASRRSVPWSGNANQWPAAAAAMGYSEGGTPRPGAIMATWESGYGHVAYVEAVLAGGSWTVSEMNFQGFGIVSSRTIRPGGVPLIAFIY